MTTMNLSGVSDREVLETLAKAASTERRATVDVVALLAEVDARRLYLGEGCASLFTYCTQVLRLSEHSAYHRIEAARAAQRFPIVLDRLRDGSLTLTAVALLRPHLTGDNVVGLLDTAAHKSKREIEVQIASLAPKADVKPLMRRLPAPHPSVDALVVDPGPDESAAVRTKASAGLISGGVAHVADPKPKLAPLSSDRYLLRVTLSAETRVKLTRAQDLLRHAVPNGDPAVIVDRALTLLVEDLERKKAAKTTKPRRTPGPSARSARAFRSVPAVVRREVWARDQGRCAFVGPRGRCTETAWLEFHHVEPFARGGSTTAANLSLRCRAHNQFESEQVFGPWVGS
jgi:5-methylcytosine-specific restriction endonuclease McrA